MAEDIVLIRNQGLDADDNNTPAPKNMPTANTPILENDGLFPGQQWGRDGVDPHHINDIHDQVPKFANWLPIKKTYFERFTKLFPANYFNDVFLAKTNKAMRDLKIQPMTKGKFFDTLVYGC